MRLNLDTRSAKARGEGGEQERSLAGYFRQRRGPTEVSPRRWRLGGVAKDEGRSAPALERVLLQVEEGAASAKALRQGPAWPVGGTVRRGFWLEKSVCVGRGAGRRRARG